MLCLPFLMKQKLRFQLLIVLFVSGTKWSSPNSNVVISALQESSTMALATVITTSTSTATDFVARRKPINTESKKRHDDDTNSHNNDEHEDELEFRRRLDVYMDDSIDVYPTDPIEYELQRTLRRRGLFEEARLFVKYKDARGRLVALSCARGETPLISDPPD